MSLTLSILTALACLAPSAGEYIVLEGIVLAPDGRPAEGVRCLVSSRADAPTFFRGHAEVFADERTEADGRFHLRVPERWIRRCDQSSLDLWVWREDLCLELLSYWAKDVPVGESLKVRTRPPVREEITVLDEEGLPVANARIHPTNYGRGLVPEGLLEGLTVRTDEGGVVTSGTWDPEQAGNLAVETERHGRQVFGGRDDWFDERELQLGAAGRLRLEVSGEVPASLPELSLRSFWFTADRSAVSRFGEFDLPLVAEGAERTWPLAAGSVHPYLDLPRAPAAVPRIGGGQVEAEELCTLKVEWIAGVPVSGRVVDAETGEPVPGVTLWISAYPMTFPVVSGADGTFEFRAPPGHLAITQIDPPGTHAGVRSGFRNPTPVEIAAEAERVDLGEIELRRARGIRGRVLDEAGEPVAGAWVYGSQLQELERGARMDVPIAALTDDGGGFEIGGSLTGEADVELAARLGTARTRSAEKFPVGSEAELVLVEGLLLPLNGTVRDGTGRPVDGATVAIWKGYADWPFQAEEELLFDGARLVTNAEGGFTADACLDPGGSYTLVITSPFIERTFTGWRIGDELREAIEVSVPRLVPLRGRLLAGDGTPRGGAPLRVTHPYRPPLTAVTDDAGRFTLDAVSPDGAVVLAELEGFGLRGRWFEGAAGGDWTIREDEPALRASAPAVARDRELALAARLAASWLAAVMESGEPESLLRPLQCLARVDPAAALEAIERVELDAWKRNAIRREVVIALAPRDPAEALSVASSMELGMSSVLARLEVLGALGPEERDRRIEIIGLALAEARRVDTPAHKLVCLARIAEWLRDLGEGDAAREVLEEARAIAGELPAAEWSGYARAVFAEELAVYELEPALELIEVMSDKSTRPRHWANIARELADLDPEAAEKVYRRLQWRKERAAPAVCYRMARVDLERARRIADGVDSAPEAYGNMARALAEENPDLAGELLDEAFQRLRNRKGSGRAQYLMGNDATVAGSLLSLAERIAPDRVREYLWQAVALRWRSTESNPDPDTRWRGLAEDATLAFFVARYDDELARALVAPALRLFEVEGSDPLQARSGDWRALCAALVEIDPEWAADLAAQGLFPRAPGSMANVLAREGEARREFVMHQYLALWIPGEEDL